MKPLGSLSLDLDNEWAYLKTHGDPAWESFPSYLDVVVPRFLEILARERQRITVFVVGQDAALEKNRSALSMLAASGHEIGNHSFHHEPWLGRYTGAQIEEEVASANEAIEAATGVRPIGFRGPGFSLSRETLEILAAHGFRYDCTTFPTYIGPLARAYYFMTAKLTAEERARRKALFGTFADGLRPLRTYRWVLAGGRSLIEIPVTTFPLLKIPIHFSYILYIATIAPPLALPYFRAALLACRALRIAPSLLLHPLDFLDGDDVATLAFFPAMNVPRAKKLAVLQRALAIYRALFDVVPVGVHADAVAATPLRSHVPAFA
ncbi:MAG: polysaccharide deacetylase family protein [Candidatus Eremiobacteraeota bacterium]|nr:polysaccharide deacetylase family protein [Candidatus Eremiobacteraeota bacterium]MBC5802852.1 polysaccharide deacetylase family protein [Candidatus Eremiobacteraeota bacterium]MBC5821469.1 polysaccharide deacetylase family protein [Candidatus Eremiobacteraeota bacterium]